MAKVKVSSRKQSTVVYIEHRGPYDTVPWKPSIEKLYAFAKEHRLRPGFRPMAIYPDDPRTTDPAACRTRVAVPVRGTARGEGDVQVGELPASTVVTSPFEGTSADYDHAFRELAEWVRANGFEPAGAPVEVYTKRPEAVGGQTRIHSRLELPVRKR